MTFGGYEYGLSSHFDQPDPLLSDAGKPPLHLRQPSTPIETVKETLLDKKPEEVLLEPKETRKAEERARQEQAMAAYVARREREDARFGFTRRRDTFDVDELRDSFEHGNAD